MAEELPSPDRLQALEGAQPLSDEIMSGVRVIRHALAEHSLTYLRDKRTGPEQYRLHARIVSHIVAADVTRDLPLATVTVDTPLEATTGQVLSAPVILVPVLRAGLAMLFAMLDFLPGSQVGMLGLERDEATAIAHAYYEKQPSSYRGAKTILLDPMLATGGSALAALERLKTRGAQDIRIACIVSCPEGITAVRSRHPDVLIYTCAIDRQLNAQAYILPGLGDFGDRYFGTL